MKNKTLPETKQQKQAKPSHKEKVKKKNKKIDL